MLTFSDGVTFREANSNENVLKIETVPQSTDIRKQKSDISICDHFMRKIFGNHLYSIVTRTVLLRYPSLSFPFLGRIHRNERELLVSSSFKFMPVRVSSNDGEK